MNKDERPTTADLARAGGPAAQSVSIGGSGESPRVGFCMVFTGIGWRTFWRSRGCGCGLPVTFTTTSVLSRKSPSGARWLSAWLPAHPLVRLTGSRKSQGRPWHRSAIASGRSIRNETA